MKSPNILIASSNARKLIENIRHLIDANAIAELEKAVGEEAKALYDLGIEHYNVAIKLKPIEWRNIVSRLYYCSYNLGRSLRLVETGVYATDLKDHKNIGVLPASLSNSARYINVLESFKEDRNSCDYDHRVVETDLFQNSAFYKVFTSDFIQDTKIYLTNKGIKL